MKIHEYQAKNILKEYGVKVPYSKLCERKEDIAKIIEGIKLPMVIKAQVYAGGRGKSGGVKIAKSYEEANKIANEMLGMELKSKQAGNKIVNKILIEEGVEIKKEIYISLTFDRKEEGIVLIISNEGGMEIEEVAKINPEKIYKKLIKEDNNAEEIIKKLGYNEKISQKISEIIKKLYKIMEEKDATLVEINPLVISKEEEVIAIDCKINFDDNALYRHKDIIELRDEKEENEYEIEAQKYGLNYIKLNGTIGCMVNGAGLAMATMDIIRLSGKTAANFLDVGGGASSEKIEKAFKILISDKNIEAVFINIFGGILRCDILAEGIKRAMETLKIQCPVIVRMEGTNKEEGSKILKESGLKFSVVKDINEAIEVIKGI